MQHDKLLRGAVGVRQLSKCSKAAARMRAMKSCETRPKRDAFGSHCGAEDLAWKLLEGVAIVPGGELVVRGRARGWIGERGGVSPPRRSEIRVHRPKRNETRNLNESISESRCIGMTNAIPFVESLDLGQEQRRLNLTQRAEIVAALGVQTNPLHHVVAVRDDCSATACGEQLASSEAHDCDISPHPGAPAVDPGSGALADVLDDAPPAAISTVLATAACPRFLRADVKQAPP